jgi:mannose-1-phosphate guanylyltransferase
MTTAMVLSAGFGTRLHPLTEELAKPLMPVGDRPMIAHAVDTLVRGGVRQIVVNTHHRAADFDRPIAALDAVVQVVHEPEILGTAGGVANAAAALGVSDVVVWNGDILAPDLDVAALIERRASRGAGALWVVRPLPRGEGTVGLDGAGNIVRLRGERFGSEEAGGDFLGIQVMSDSFRAALPARGCLVADVALPLLRRGETIGAFAFEGEWDDIGTPASFLRANLRWLARNGLTAFSAADARVDARVRLERTVVGAGAAVLGDGAVRESVIFPGAELRAPAERAIVGRLAVVAVAEGMADGS